MKKKITITKAEIPTGSAVPAFHCPSWIAFLPRADSNRIEGTMRA